jgi:uncharacterized protein YfbU (UPF0304 family)
MTERFEMRLDQKTLEAVDEWRSQQADLPSRAEAIRRLIEVGLLPAEKKITLRDGEKLILLMLCEVYKHLKIKGDIEPGFVEEAIHGGHYWGLEWKYSGIFHGHEDNSRVVSEVVNVLDMWTSIERGYAKLSAAAKSQVEKEATPFGKDVHFRGFDGNNEAEHLGIAGFLIRDLERFSDFKGRDLNSHAPSIDTYRRMMQVYEPMRRTLMGGELGMAAIIQILNAMTHPSRRGRLAE